MSQSELEEAVVLAVPFYGFSPLTIGLASLVSVAVVAKMLFC